MSPVVTFLEYAATAIAAAGIAITVAAGASRLRRPLRWALATAAVAALAVAATSRVDQLVVVDAGVVLVAGTLASLFSGTITSVAALTGVAVAAAVADAVSFLLGPTRLLLEHDRSGLVRYLAVGLPATGGLTLVVGFGDLLFVAVFALTLTRLGSSIRAGLAAPLLGLVAALGFGQAVGGAAGIPFMAATTVGYALVGLRRRRGR